MENIAVDFLSDPNKFDQGGFCKRIDLRDVSMMATRQEKSGH